MYNLKALVHNKKNYLLFINILIELLELFEGVLLKVIFIELVQFKESSDLIVQIGVSVENKCLNYGCRNDDSDKKETMQQV